jgi:hypothetical protein
MTDPVVKNGGAAYVPPDLLNDASQIQDNKDYIDVVLTDLNLDTEYKMQFAWVYEDKTISDYSDVFSVTTLAEETLKRPQFLESDLTTSLNALIVNWSGLDYLGSAYPKSFDRVDIYVKGGDFGSTYVVAGSFKEAGKQTIIAQAGTYYVKLRAVSKLGTPSDFSDEWSANTSNPAEVIEPPTLPIGLTVSTTAFGISVNWNGAYQADDPFSGFKTIEVYATTNAGLGASTTTAFTSSSLVANLTVTQSLNRQNVGIDNLKQALGLATSAAVYAANVYFYYIAYNKNNEPYKVGDVATYTRISATPLSPTKANLIDLENGIISIENLVAGNGKFTSWLRAGSDTGGSRIELNGSNTFADGVTGRSILDGFTVYGSGNNPIFRASTTSGTVTFGGYAPSDIDSIKATSDSKTKLFRQATAPTSVTIGDLWINTADTTIGRNTIYIATKVGANSITVDPVQGWVVAKDLDITKALAKADAFNEEGNINRAIQIPSPNSGIVGSIYSGKSSYASQTAGWFLGYDGTDVNSSPVIHIGNSNNHFKWTGSAIDVKGSFTTTGTQSGLLGGNTNLTTTLNAGKLSLSSDQTTGFMDWANAAVLEVSSTDSQATISPAGIAISHTGLSSGFSISYVPGGGYANIIVSGGGSPLIRWVNYQGPERTANLMLGDIANRPLVVTDQGLQYLGAQNYYTNSSSATMATATWGVDGDLAFSTNAN